MIINVLKVPRAKETTVFVEDVLFQTTIFVEDQNLKKHQFVKQNKKGQKKDLPINIYSHKCRPKVPKAYYYHCWPFCNSALKSQPRYLFAQSFIFKFYSCFHYQLHFQARTV
jgi:hypothetical protein